MTALPWTLAELLPHSGTMILIDEPVRFGKDCASATVRIGEDSLFYRAEMRGVPAWVGLEYMAQTVALYAGACAKRAGRDIGIGLLLGTRRYTAATDRFRLGALLVIRVTESWHEGQMGVFDCCVEGEEPLAEATLNVFRPADPLAFLKEQRE